MKFLLNHQEQGWLMLDVEGNRSLGLFDSEDKALERAWLMASETGVDALVYSRNSPDDDSIIVVSGLRRCSECGSMRPAEDYELNGNGHGNGNGNVNGNGNGNGNGQLKSTACKDCADGGASLPPLVILDDADHLSFTENS